MNVKKVFGAHLRMFVVMIMVCSIVHVCSTKLGLGSILSVCD